MMNRNRRGVGALLLLTLMVACSDDAPRPDGAMRDSTPDTREVDLVLGEGHTSDVADLASTDLGAFDAGPDKSLGACATMTSPVGRSLSVKYGDQTIDFSSGAFDSGYNNDIVHGERYWYFFVKSVDGKYGLELRMAPDSVLCPETIPLPVSDRLMVIFFDAELFTEIATSEPQEAAGSLTIEGYITTVAHKEIAFECKACVLAPPPASPLPSVVVEGSLRLAK